MRSHKDEQADRWGNERRREREREREGGRGGGTVSICMMAVWLRQDNCNLSRRHERRVNFIAAIPESQWDGKTGRGSEVLEGFCQRGKSSTFHIHVCTGRKQPGGTERPESARTEVSIHSAFTSLSLSVSTYRPADLSAYQPFQGVIKWRRAAARPFREYALGCLRVNVQWKSWHTDGGWEKCV